MNKINTTPIISQDDTQTLNGYKKTAIGIIPIDWDVKRLSQIGELKNGINKDKDQFGFGFPLINLNDVFEINTDHDKEFSLVNSNEKERRDYCLNKGDVLFVRSSVKATGVGLTCVILNDIKDAVYSGFIIRFRDNHFLDLNYKVHCFYEQGFRNRLLAKSTISANININQVALNSLQLAVPPPLEQQKIAEILSTWDDAITNCKNTIDNLKNRNKGLAQQLLTGKKRLSGFSNKWENLKLECFFKERNETGVINLDLLSIGELGIYPQSESNKRDNSNFDKLKYKRICPGDIGYNTMRMWQGRSALSQLEGIVSPAYTIITPMENANGKYFSYLFKMKDVIHMFFRNSQGLVNDTLNCKFKDFKLIKINVPTDIKEQEAIAKVLETANQELKSYETKLEALQLQKKGLMQQLLTGKIRVNVK